MGRDSRKGQSRNTFLARGEKWEFVDCNTGIPNFR